MAFSNNPQFTLKAAIAMFVRMFKSLQYSMWLVPESRCSTFKISFPPFPVHTKGLLTSYINVHGLKMFQSSFELNVING
jgi:hypothetical protein